jgi:hypothetical protein
MNHPGIDPSLRAAEPPPETLADGSSPAAESAGEEPEAAHPPPDKLALPPKSPF